MPHAHSQYLLHIDAGNPDDALQLLNDPSRLQFIKNATMTEKPEQSAPYANGSWLSLSASSLSPLDVHVMKTVLESQNIRCSVHSPDGRTLG